MVPLRIIWITLGVAGLWILSTYLLERKRKTFLRPGQKHLRLTYALVSNVLFGLIVPGSLLLFLAWKGLLPSEFQWFNRHTPIGLPAGLVLGLTVYLLQKPPRAVLTVHINIFFQVLAVSAAEVFVCWGLLATMLEAFFLSWIVVPPVLFAALLSALVFGLYHIGHSPPYHSARMIVLLTVVGLFTSMFFFISRNLFGTLIFHNFLALFGIMRSLGDQGRLAEYGELKGGLIVTGLFAVLVLVFFVVAIGMHWNEQLIPPVVRMDTPLFWFFI